MEEVLLAAVAELSDLFQDCKERVVSLEIELRQLSMRLERLERGGVENSWNVW